MKCESQDNYMYRGREGGRREGGKCNVRQTWRSSDGGNHGSSAQQQSYSENSQLHLDQEQLRESLKKITFFPT